MLRRKVLLFQIHHMRLLAIFISLQFTKSQGLRDGFNDLMVGVKSENDELIATVTCKADWTYFGASRCTVKYPPEGGQSTYEITAVFGYDQMGDGTGGSYEQVEIKPHSIYIVGKSRNLRSINIDFEIYGHDPNPRENEVESMENMPYRSETNGSRGERIVNSASEPTIE